MWPINNVRMTPRVFWTIAILLGLLNFALQGFDFFAWQNNDCGFYYYDADCMNWGSFVLNKVVRLSLNISLLWIIQWQFFIKQAKQFLSLIIALIILGAIDILLLQTASFIGLRTHEFLHPVVFSPLLAMVILSVNTLKPKGTLAS